MDLSEANCLTYCIGYMLQKTICSKSFCEKCKAKLVQDEQTSVSQALITQKAYIPGALTYPTETARLFFSYSESVYNNNCFAIRRGGHALDLVFEHLHTVGRSSDYDIPICHLDLLIRRFFKIRMYFEASEMNNRLREYKVQHNVENKSKYASRSMAGVALK